MKKSKKKNVKNIKKENTSDMNQFSFDDEIVIGVTNIKEPKSSKNLDNKKSTKKNTKNKRKKNIKKKEKKVKEEKILTEEELRVKKHNSRLIKFMILLVLIVVIIVAIMFSPLFNVKKITVVGNEKISENEIISLSQINIEENTYKINKVKVVKNIKQNPYIENVEIKRVLPSGIQIIVEERKVSYQIEYGGNYIYINNQGYILEISDTKKEVPIIQGVTTSGEDFVQGNRLIKEDLMRLTTVLKIIEFAEANEFDTLITSIDISNKDDYKLELESEGKIVYLGDCSNLSTRMLNVKAILEKEKGIEGEIFVDMDLNYSYPTFRQKV